MKTYSVYGLSLESEIPLPELFEDTQTTNLSLTVGSLEFVDPRTYPIIYRPVSPSQIYVFYRNVATALVTDGRQVVVHPVEGVDPLTLRLFILQQVLGVALLQLGYFVLHASAVVINGQAVAFAGNSGEGKSTLAALLNTRGYPILTDDVLAIDTRPELPLAYPGLLQLKLTEEARASVAPEILGEQTIHEKRAKKLCAIRGAALREPAPLHSIFLLATGSALEFSPVAPAKAAIELVRHTYGSKLVQAIGQSGAYFEQCIAVARRAKVATLTRPRDLSIMPQIADQIVASIA
jgi:hypothetical protein